MEKSRGVGGDGENSRIPRGRGSRSATATNRFNVTFFFIVEISIRTVSDRISDTGSHSRSEIGAMPDDRNSRPAAKGVIGISHAIRNAIFRKSRFQDPANDGYVKRDINATKGE